MKPKKILSHCLGWGLTLVFSGVLNAFLFGIMPGMIQQVPQRPDHLEKVRAIQVVRIKRPEPPPRKKEPPRPKEPKTKPLETKKTSLAYTPKPLAITPNLPFELNPRLPRAVNTLDMPPMAHFSMNAPAFKGIYPASELDSPLTPLAKVPPIYPLRAARRGIQGWVTVKFVVNISGSVEDLEILDANPAQIFDSSVVNCVAQWKFKPGTMEGVAVPTLAQTTIKFQLE